MGMLSYADIVEPMCDLVLLRTAHILVAVRCGEVQSGSLPLKGLHSKR